MIRFLLPLVLCLSPLFNSLSITTLSLCSATLLRLVPLFVWHHSFFVYCHSFFVLAPHLKQIVFHSFKPVIHDVYTCHCLGSSAVGLPIMYIYGFCRTVYIRHTAFIVHSDTIFWLQGSPCRFAWSTWFVWFTWFTLCSGSPGSPGSPCAVVHLVHLVHLVRVCESMPAIAFDCKQSNTKLT